MTTVIHKRDMRPGDVYIGRPSKWGNPFVIGKGWTMNRNDTIAAYRAWISARPELIQAARVELRGKRLACWCAPLPCHGDVLADIANS